MTNLIKAFALLIMTGIIATGAYAITEHVRSSEPTISYPYHPGAAEREIIAEGIRNFMPGFEPRGISVVIDRNGISPYACGLATDKYVYGHFIPDEDGKYVFEPIFVGNGETEKMFMRSLCGSQWIYN